MAQMKTTHKTGSSNKKTKNCWLRALQCFSFIATPAGGRLSRLLSQCAKCSWFKNKALLVSGPDVHETTTAFIINFSFVTSTRRRYSRWWAARLIARIRRNQKFMWHLLMLKCYMASVGHPNMVQLAYFKSGIGGFETGGDPGPLWLWCVKISTKWHRRTHLSNFRYFFLFCFYISAIFWPFIWFFFYFFL